MKNWQRGRQRGWEEEKEWKSVYGGGGKKESEGNEMDGGGSKRERELPSENIENRAYHSQQNSDCFSWDCH